MSESNYNKFAPITLTKGTGQDKQECVVDNPYQKEILVKDGWKEAKSTAKKDAD